MRKQYIYTQNHILYIWMSTEIVNYLFQYSYIKLDVFNSLINTLIPNFKISHHMLFDYFYNDN
jgi:hypothetical protein